MTQAYPLAWPDGWPRTEAAWRKSSYRFGRDLTLYKAVTGLLHELSLLGAVNLVVSSDVEPRLDGLPRSGAARAVDPGAAVYFTYGESPMTMAQDAFDSTAGNIRSLALAVAHLRGLERHGGGYMMERAFMGFTALPPPKAAKPVQSNWRDLFGPVPQGLAPLETLAVVEARYKARAKLVHSDSGGDDAQMIVLNAAIARAREELRP